MNALLKRIMGLPSLVRYPKDQTIGFRFVCNSVYDKHRFDKDPMFYARTALEELEWQMLQFVLEQRKALIEIEKEYGTPRKE